MKALYLLPLIFVFLLQRSDAFEPSDAFQRSNALQQPDPAPRSDTMVWPSSFGFGRQATVSELAALDISIRPDGKGLPAGSGNAMAGKIIYAAKCAVCHGRTGTEGPFMQLVSKSNDSLRIKTIGNYWPYATTIFDYTRRAMPFNAPGSLSDNEVYSLTAFLLAANRVIDSQMVITASNLADVKMPARGRYVPDDRKGGPEVR
jgi:mono/diheme cytochrome c family protein